MINNIFRHLKMLVQTPKDYLYSYTYSTKKKIYHQPYNPNTKKIALSIKELVDSRCSNLKVEIIGSTGLGIMGRGDIDIIAGCPSDQLVRCADKISRLYGKPFKCRKDFIEWEFYLGKYKVEIVLASDNSKLYQEQIRVFNILKTNKKYLDKYQKLKQNSYGKSQRNYAWARIQFFNQLLRQI